MVGMHTHAERSHSLPAMALGITFLIMGLTFGLPIEVVPEAVRVAHFPTYSIETANVFAFVAWAGWAHFLFAYRGQIGSLARSQGSHGRLLGLVGAFGVAIAILVAVRAWMGPTVFGGIVWVYFIDHFVKSERLFEGNPAAHDGLLARWTSLIQPLASFGWLTLVLNNVGDVIHQPWMLWGVSLFLGAVFFALGGWRGLMTSTFRGPLLALFFVGEALVWGALGRYTSPGFLTGVYVFHVAAGSYFHYLGSYFYACARTESRPPVARPLPILLTNLAVMALGWMVVRSDSLAILTPILGLEWFTLWVAMHLVMSDVFPLLRRRL